MRKIVLLLLLSIVFTISCKDTTKLKWSVYHWKLDVAGELLINDNNKFSTIYLHIMDVDWNEELKSAVPKNSLKINPNQIKNGSRITPVFFISPKVFAQIDSAQIQAFASQILTTRNQFLQSKKIIDTKTLQIDCDWLASHKEKYFYFLRLLKELDDSITLSVTVRLYPYKYSKKMGVPPVDYGVLMCYNMDEIKSKNTENSIIDTEVLRGYLKEVNYSIPIKPALPLYGWYVVFNSNQQYLGIFYSDRDLVNVNTFTHIGDNNYQLAKDTVLNHIYVRKGDVIRKEFPSEQILQESIHILKDNIPKFDEIILYHWDNNNLDPHYDAFFKENIFR